MTSTGQDDTGLFETNLRDERYLPFEGDGAVSEWQLSLPGKFRQFDYESISDVVMHLRYTAREGGETLADHAVDKLDEALNDWVRGGGGKSLYRAFSARREFADQWSRFISPSDTMDPTVTMTISKDRFPFPFRGFGINVTKLDAVLVLSRDRVPDGSKRYLDCYPGGLDAKLTVRQGNPTTVALTPDPSLGGVARGAFQIPLTVGETSQDWTISLSRAQIANLDQQLRTENGTLNPAAVVDLLLVSQYKLVGG